MTPGGLRDQDLLLPGERQRQALPWAGGRATIIAMVHLAPLPGSPGWAGSMEAVRARALSDAATLVAGGVDALLIENFGDVPFLGGTVDPDTVAAMAVIVDEIARLVPVPVGVNVLRNDARAALAVAVAGGASFIRVNVHVGTMWSDQGPLHGQAAETLRVRRALGAPVAILADVLVKHAVAPAGLTLEDAARDTWIRGLADGLVVSGRATGDAPDPQRIRSVREAIPEAPLVVGSGVTPETAAFLLADADAAIVGSALQRGGIAGRGVEEARVHELMEHVARLRGL